jgi:hypothetical protein
MKEGFLSKNNSTDSIPGPSSAGIVDSNSDSISKVTSIEFVHRSFKDVDYKDVTDNRSLLSFFEKTADILEEGRLSKLSHDSKGLNILLKEFEIQSAVLERFNNDDNLNDREKTALPEFDSSFNILNNHLTNRL